GILSGDGFQIVYSDTPGLLEPKYELHKKMMAYVQVSLEDADLVLLVVELGEKHDPAIFDRLKKVRAPIFLVINKTDLAKGSQLEDKTNYWKAQLAPASIIPVSALTGENVDKLLEEIIRHLPVHPPYYPKDNLTDKSERFFASEIIREKIFLNYGQEVPYSSEVSIEEFKDTEAIIRIRAVIYVERDSQKGILIGKGGASLKKVGTEARKDLEAFFNKKVFLETHVKVADNWRKQKQRLKQFGYTD
nr:GTPase Era [Cyclobacteriaceae bacterium]